MNSILAKWKSRDFVAGIIFLEVTVNVTVLLDVPVARQVVGFLNLTFVPGFLIIKMLKLDELDGLETVLFSVGLSAAFLMLAGLLMNEFGFLLGISQPLSLIPLMGILNSLMLMGTVFVYLRSKYIKPFWAGSFRLSPSTLLFTVLPILSAVGVMWVNIYGNNMILLFMMVTISFLFVAGVISKRSLPSQLYPLAILMIAISLLYHSSLVSNYIVGFGSDVPIEYFVFKTTANNANWSSTLPSFWDPAFCRINAMLSVTILPTIYSISLNMDPTWTFKIIFPLIFSFVPLGLYWFWQKYMVGRKQAFFAAFLFMVQSTFYTEMLGLNRQMVAELFFVLLLLVILNKKIKPFNKSMCFMIFSVALVTSHYALAEIFLFFISFVFIFLVVLRRPSRNITASIIVLFFVVMFAWYIYTSGSAVFDSFLSFGDYICAQLGEFSNIASRGRTIIRGLGLEAAPSIWNTVSRAFAYATEALIVSGFLGLILKRTRIQFEKEYFALSLTAMAFLATLILVPGLANTLNMTRFYHILLFFLAPFSVIGATVIVKLIFKREREFVVSILLLIVLVPYLLFQTGFVYEVTGSESYSIPLSGHRMDALQLYGFSGYTDEQSEVGAVWMSKNAYVEHTQIYADAFSRRYVLTLYGSIYPGFIDSLSNTTVVASNGTVYLGKLSVVDRVVDLYTIHEFSSWNFSELSFDFANLNIVYTNGGSEIYKNSP